MSPEVSFTPTQWTIATQQIEARFRTDLSLTHLPSNFTLAELTEALAVSISDDASAHCTHALIWLEIEKAMAMALGISPEGLSPTTKMRHHIPPTNRKAAWETLAHTAQLRLPQLGTPPWLQHLLGFLLLAGFVLPFYSLWLGLGLFWGVLLLSWPLEKLATAFPYPTFGKMVARTVQLNPRVARETGADKATIQALLAETLAGLPGPQMDLPQADTRFNIQP